MYPNINLPKIKQLTNLINDSTAIIIGAGAGAGLSTAAGFEYDGKTFFNNFKYMYDKYGYQDMYSASFHNFSSSIEKWGYYSKFIYLNRYQEVKPLYQKLYQIMKDKNYFIITTNVDHQFQKASFSKNRLFYTQGDYGLFQCSIPCHNKTYDNEQQIKEMIDKQIDHKIPHNLIPRCPICHNEMVPNLRSDERFVEDEGWHKSALNYQKFLKENESKKVLFLELGVGYNTPSIIKYPFWQMTKLNPLSHYVCINKNETYIPKEIKDRSIIINEDINDVINIRF